MAKRDDDENSYQHLKNELIADIIKDAFKNHGQNWANKLEEAGLVCADDGYAEDEEMEERTAQPENQNQEYLIAYFERLAELNEKVLTVFELRSCVASSFTIRPNM